MNFASENTQVTSSTSSILKIVIPLILSALSANLMFLIDRFVLAHYSLDSMNAAILGGNLVSIYVFIFFSIAGTTEIFVGQCNGAKLYNGIASSVWQMIYFVLFAVICMIPAGYFSKYLNLIPLCYAEEGIEYQKILTYFCWLPALMAAFSGFFVGRGKTKIITIAVVSGTLINIVLDYILVFGFWKIPSLGCRGAAIATVIAETTQVLILAVIFWNKKNRTLYKTLSNNKFDKELFFKCIKIGSPMAIGQCIEMFAWYLVGTAVSSVSKELSTIQGIASTIYIAFLFICEGLTKGTAAISTNFIGQENLLAIRQSLRKLMTFALILCSCVMLPILLFPKNLLILLKTVNSDLLPLFPTILFISKITFVSITLESFYAIKYGILLAGGDTKYPNIANLICVFILVVFPILVLSHLGKLQSAVIVPVLCVCWQAIRLVIIHMRYKQMKWYNLLVK